jgi:hypothetical protein
VHHAIEDNNPFSLLFGLAKFDGCSPRLSIAIRVGAKPSTSEGIEAVAGL